MKLCLNCQTEFVSEDWYCPACGFVPVTLDGVEAHAPVFAHGGGGFKPEYFSELARLEEKNFWFRARNDIILWALRTYKPDAGSFLEVGCGTGFVLSGIAQAYPQLSLSASEIFLAGLSYAAQRVASAKFMQMDARRIPFINEFDVIGAFDVLEHIHEDEATLAQIHQAMRPGGLLLLTVPQHRHLWSAVDEYACHVRRYQPGELDRKVASAGFRVLRSTSFVTLLLPAMMLSRLSQDRKGQAMDPADEMKIGSALNQILYGLMRAEIAGIRAGLDYPFGGSRLVIAAKPRNP